MRLHLLAACSLLLVACSSPQPEPRQAPQPEPKVEVPSEVDPALGESSSPPAWFGLALGRNAASQWEALSPKERVAWAQAVIAGGALAPPAGGTEERRSFEALAATGSEPDRRAARERVVASVVQAVLADLSYASLSPKGRSALGRALADSLRDESFEKSPGGGYRYRAVASLEEARERALDTLQVEELLASEEFVLAVDTKDWFDGDGLNAAERRVLPGVIGGRCSESLLRFRMRQASSEGEAERIRRAALELGVSPSTAKKRSFRGMFQAGWVVTVRGAIRFEPFAEGSARAKEHFGYLRAEGLRVQVYNRTQDQVIAEFVLSSSPDLREPRSGSARLLHQPWVRKDGAFAEQVESYAGAIGHAIGVNVVRRLLLYFYRAR